MPNPRLFQPITLRSLDVRNRLWVAPMCQYSAKAISGPEAGVPGNWHLLHLGALGRGGAGLVMVEATAVTPEGRISPNCLGLWNETQQQAFAEIVPQVQAHGARIGVQLAHAGRKASSYPWFPQYEPGTSVPESESGWQTVAPSELPFGKMAHPRKLSVSEVADVIEAFVAAAGRAVAAGFDVVEIHAAHGYLLHEFLSPITNTRDDEFGGSLENRAKPLRAIVQGIRAAHPDLPVLVRISGDEWTPDGFTIDEARRVVTWLAEDGVDFVDASSSGNLPDARIPIGPGYQVWIAEKLRGLGVPIGTVGLITSPEQAENILITGQADVVSLGRPLLANPHLPIVWANALRAPSAAELTPDQYSRANFT